MLDIGALYVEHWAAIRRYLRRLAPYLDTAMIEDLTADTFERALRAAHRYQDRGHKPLTWLCPIARNLLIDHQRRYATRNVSSLDLLVEQRSEPRATATSTSTPTREPTATPTAATCPGVYIGSFTLDDEFMMIGCRKGAGTPWPARIVFDTRSTPAGSP